MIHRHHFNIIGVYEKTSTKVNILKKSNTFSNNDYMDWHLYKIRHLIKNTFARIKQFRGIATHQLQDGFRDR